MQSLPAISEYIIPAPPVSEKSYTKKNERFIPDEPEGNFWQSLYTSLMLQMTASDPVENMSTRINPYFGFFGKRWHPEHHESSFHSGIDISGTSKTPVRAMASGILEYSGYGVINGNYIMMSHPQISTEDGFVFHSLYIHLSTIAVKFSAYQKMLREISLHTYPQIHITQDDILGHIGKTGASSYPENYTHVHIQCEFRNKEGAIVFVDPYRILRGEDIQNITAPCTDNDAYHAVYRDHIDDITDSGLEDVWKKKPE